MKSLYLIIFTVAWLILPSALLANPEHPRLLVTAADWKSLPSRMDADPRVKKIVTATIARADLTLEAPLLTYERQGRRILSVSRDAIKRVLDLSTAWKVTGDKKYLDRCRNEMLAISNFKDWNPDHHLDTAEMQTALAIGYDWLFHDLTDSDKKIIAHTLIEKGLKSTLNHDYVMNRHNNWNQVCMGGLVLSAIALSDLEPELSKKALTAATQAIPRGLNAGYPPDGAYSEGGGYWSYGTIYTILTIEALRTSNNPFETILSHPGLLQSGYFIRQVHGTSNRLFCYGDNHDGNFKFNSAMCWMAKQNQSRLLSDFIAPTYDKLDATAHDRFLALAAFWIPEKFNPNEKPLPNHFHGTGMSPIAVHRTGFKTKDLYLGIKAGKADVNHGHMDAGSFVIDWQGKRWASDLGVQSYHPLESTGINLFQMTQDSPRWSVFRLNNFSHNTLTYNNQLHQMEGKSEIVSSKGAPHHETIINLAPPLNLPKNATATRHFKMNSENKIITITDTLTGLNPKDQIIWNLFTRAIPTQTDAGFIFTIDDAKMQLDLSSPQSSKPTTSPADPPPKTHDESNPGINRVQLNATADNEGKILINAAFKVLP
ncbi:MAG: heparinase II/III family protein [Akkermansiaceae bacterium]